MAISQTLELGQVFTIKRSAILERQRFRSDNTIDTIVPVEPCAESAEHVASSTATVSREHAERNSPSGQVWHWQIRAKFNGGCRADLIPWRVERPTAD